MTPRVSRPVGLCRCGCGKQTSITREDCPRFDTRKGEPAAFCRGHSSRGANAWNFKGGRSESASSGYVRIVVHGHHRADKFGWVFEHILIAERALGKPLLAKHPIHHIDGNTSNNADSNLVVCESLAYHELLHRRQRAMDACGNPSATVCRYCGSYDRQGEMHHFHVRRRTGTLTPAAYHYTCSREFRRSRTLLANPGARKRTSKREKAERSIGNYGLDEPSTEEAAA